MAIGSIIAKGIKNLPEEFVTKADSLPNVLKKMGAKQEELDFSKIDLPKSGKVTKADLVKAESERKDFFEVVKGSGDYKNYSLPKGRSNPTYREKVLTFKEGPGRIDEAKQKAYFALEDAFDGGAIDVDAAELNRLADAAGVPNGVNIEDWLVDNLDNTTHLEKSRYTSSHFPETPNYLMHTRVYDDNIDGVPTRVLQEVQSDLHQAGRQQGYGTSTVKVDESMANSLLTQIDNIEAEYGFSANANSEYMAAIRQLFTGTTGRPVTTAADEVAVDTLANAESLDDIVSAFSESQGIPKSPFEKTWLRKGIEREINDALDEGMGQIAIPIKGSVDDLHRGEGVQKWYENVVAKTAEKIAKSKGMDFVLTQPPKVDVSFITEDFVSKAKAAGDKIPIVKIGQGVPIEDVINSAHARKDAIANYLAERMTPEQHDIASVSNLVDFISSYSGDVPFIQKLIVDNSDAGADFVQYAIMKPKGGTLQQAIPEEALQAVLDGPRDVAQQKLLDLGVTRSEARDLLFGNKTAKQVADAEKVLKGGAKPEFSLYSTPAAAIGAAAIMLSEGHSEKDINYLLSEEGYDKAEIEEIFGKANAAATMKAEGYSDEEVKSAISQQEEVSIADTNSVAASELPPPKPGRISDAYRALTGNEGLTPKELLAKMEIAYPDMSAVTTNVIGFFGDQEAQRVSEEGVAASRSRIVDEMANRGLQLRWDDKQGDWIATTEDGEFVVTPEWYKSFWEMKGELVGAVSGAALGLKAGLAVPVPHPLIKSGLGFLGALVGGAIGSVGGTELDYMHSAMVLQQDFEAEIMARKAMTAAELSIIGDTVVGAAFKIGAKSWQGIVRAKNFIKHGFFDKAGTALKETMFITDEEADELVKKLSAVSNVPGKTKAEKRIAAVALTKPGAEDLVKAAAAADSTAGQAIAKAVSERADDLLKTTKGLTDENIGRWLREDLEGYKTLVKDEFTRVKTATATTPRLNMFEFDYKELAIDPVLERLGKNIENPDLAAKFYRQADKIRSISKGRRLPDLLDLRKLVNKFRYNTRISSAKDYKMLDEIRGRIDSAIEAGAKATMDNPDQWLKSWQASNKSYSEMKILEKNALAKLLTRPGVSEKAIAQGLTKYANSLDSTFVDVLAKLPKKTKTQVEGAVINTLTEKYAEGAVGGQRAINFPALAEDLRSISLSTPEARAMKRAINDLSEVFLNDIPLSRAAGGIQIQKFQSFLTADPVMRAKFEIASQSFNWVKSKAPTAQGRALTLVRKAAKVLEHPAHSKSIKELREAAGEAGINLDNQINELMKGAAKQMADGSGMPRAKLYGDGKVLVAKGKGAEHSVPIHRIASADMIKQVSEATGINLADKKALDMALKERGYMAAQLGADKVRLLEK